MNQVLDRKQYAGWRQKVVINALNNNIYALLVTQKGRTEKYYIDDTATSIIKEFSGLKSKEEAIVSLAEKYHDSYQNVEEIVNDFLITLQKEYHLDIEFSEEESISDVIFSELKRIYPHVASIELTEACNLKCKHCYGEFGEKERKRYMPLKAAKKLLSDLDAMGVVTVELTGGDISVYPYLKQLVEHALQLNFGKIALLTNGVVLSEGVMDLVVKNKSRFLVQIDLHSLSDDYLEWFTGSPNTLNVIQRKIKFFADQEVMMRISTIVTRRNYKEIPAIADWVYQSGSKIIGISPVINLGRAKMNEDLILNDLEYLDLEEELRDINEKYPNFISFVVEAKRDNIKNCGCLTSHVVITATGKLKICTMDSTDYFNSVLGNVFEQNIQQICDNNMEYLIAFSKLDAPNHESKECNECSERAFCSKCILRGLISAKEQKKCTWYNEVVPEVIKRQLEIY